MRIAIGTDQGVVILESVPGQDETWKFVSHCYQERRFNCVIESYNHSILAATSQGALYKTKDYRNWMAAADGLNGLNVTSLCSHPSNPLLMYAGTQPPQLYFSETAGLRWHKIESFNKIPGSDDWYYPEPPYRASLKCLIMHAQYPSVVLAGVSRGGFMGSLDGGATWMERHISIEREVNSLAMHPARSNRLFAATSTGLYRSDDLGSNWELLQHGLPYSYARCLVIAPGDANHIMCCMSQARSADSPQVLLLSTDGGDSWQVKGTSLPNLSDQPVTCLDACGSECFAFATEKGNVYVTTNGGLFWRHIHRGTAAARSILFQGD